MPPTIEPGSPDWCGHFRMLFRFLEQVACGLMISHSQGVVHLDLKPDNIFICQVEDRLVAKVRVSRCVPRPCFAGCRRALPYRM